MSYKFGARSEKQLSTIHPELVKVFRRAIQITEQDFTVIEGYRSLADQQKAFASGNSTLKKGAHNFNPARAADVIPAPFLDYDDPLLPHKLGIIAKAMKTASAELGIPITWGGDWKSFKDRPHFELKSFRSNKWDI